MDYSFFIEYLKQKAILPIWKKDILDTWNELQKNPIDFVLQRKARQVLQNDAGILRDFLCNQVNADNSASSTTSE